MSAPSHPGPAPEPLTPTDARNSSISSDELKWRLGVSQAAVVPSVADQVVLARLCRAAGLADVSRMVYQAACLQFGFAPGSPSRTGEWSVTPEAAGLWRPKRAKAADKLDGRGTVARAIDDLRTFAHTHAGELAAKLTPSNEGGTASIVSAASGLANEQADLLHSVEALFAFLSTEWSPVAGAKVEAHLVQLRNLAALSNPVDWRLCASAPLSLLAEVTVLASLQDFMFENSVFTMQTTSSAALLHAGARFDPFGLGPFFANVSRIARSSRDIFELAQLAQTAGGAPGACITREQWVVLLSGRLPGRLRDEVIDDLGDIGATAALAFMLDQAQKQPQWRIDNTVATRIRDAALDNADHGLAARAQAVSVRLNPTSVLERRLLGEIYASAGLTRVAEQLFVACLEADGNDAVVQERLTALRSGTFDQFHVQNGFGTPPDRLQTRRLRRQSAPR